MTSGFMGTVTFPQGDLLVGALEGKAYRNPLAARWAGTLGVGYLTRCAWELPMYACTLAHVYTHLPEAPERCIPPVSGWSH